MKLRTRLRKEIGENVIGTLACRAVYYSDCRSWKVHTRVQFRYLGCVPRLDFAQEYFRQNFSGETYLLMDVGKVVDRNNADDDSRYFNQMVFRSLFRRQRNLAGSEVATSV